IRTGHRLLVLGGNRIMDWEPATGHVLIWKYDPTVRGAHNPLSGSPIVDYTWGGIRTGHELIVLPGNRIMDWEPANGHVRIWNYDPNVTGNRDPLPGNAVVDYTWGSIRT